MNQEATFEATNSFFFQKKVKYLKLKWAHKNEGIQLFFSLFFLIQMYVIL